MTAIIQAPIEVPSEDMFSKRAVRRATKAGYQEIGEYWADKMLPSRFKEGNTNLFQFAPRAARYQAEKERLARLRPDRYPFRGKVPLVRTGRMAARLMQDRQIRAFPTRVTIKMPGPPWLRAMRSRPNAPDMTAEILQVPIFERRELSRRLKQRVIKELESRRGKYLYNKPAGDSSSGGE